MSPVETKRGLAERILRGLDPRLSAQLLAGWRQSRGVPRPLEAHERVAIVGHRAAGKTTALPLFAQLLERPAIDLDADLERRHVRGLRQWLVEDMKGFRAAEREAFVSLDPSAVVAVGGGFLSLHGDLLAGVTAVLLPMSFETYAERLRADVTRPRLRPDLSLEEEWRTTYSTREEAHRRVPTVAVVDFLARVAPARSP